jgi:lysophospholipase L1-like esterase
VSRYSGIEKFFTLLGKVSCFITITVALLIVGHYVIGMAHSLMTSRLDDLCANSPVYDNFPDSRAFWKEEQKRGKVSFEPYYHWKQDELIGKYINIDAQGVRRTVKDPTARAAKIFMFGGSTLWGQGAPDKDTIPSHVQALLGNAYDVYNYGEDGFVSTQELNYLLYQLSLGNVPDAVIFYDGVNDGYAGVYSPAIPRDPQNLRMADLNRSDSGFIQWITQSNYEKLAKYIVRITRGGYSGSEAWDQKVKPDVGINARQVVKMYEAHTKQVRALAKEYQFKAFFFWQPNLLSLTKKMSLHERDMVSKVPPVMVESQRQVFQEARTMFTGSEKEGIYFIGNVFDEIEHPLYWDWCHVGPEGNRLIANKIIELIGEEIRNLP